ncbi:MAG: cohesin domain-containing protein [Candidatus Zixiibacteriota bacterium]
MKFFRLPVLAGAVALFLGSVLRPADCPYAQQQFIRGDADGDCLVSWSDAVFLTCYLYLGGPVPACWDAADANDDGIVNTGDVVTVLNHIMTGNPLPPPFPAPGNDPTPDGLDCATQCVSPTASSSDSLIVPSVEALAGGSVAVSVICKNVQPLLSYQMLMEYDSSVLHVTTVDTTGTATGSAGPYAFSFETWEDGGAIDIWCTIDCAQSAGIPPGRDILVKVVFQVDQDVSCADSLLEIKNVTQPAFRGNLFGYASGKVYPTLAAGNVAVGPSPLILSIADVGNDQGRQVRVKWNRSCHDEAGSSTTITEYGIWRRIGDDKEHGESYVSVSRASRVYPPGEWDFIKNVPARGEEEYNTVCPTLGDSTEDGGVYWSVFFVSAMTSDPLVYFDSDPDSGYSLDNIPPLPIRDLQIDPNSWFTLHWTVPGEYVGEEPISAYDIRYSTDPVGIDTQTWWDNAEPCTGEGFFNFIVGEEDSFGVAEESGCHPELYFAVKGLDDRPNASGISNVVHFLCGDDNGDGIVDVGDVVHEVCYLFRNGPAPSPRAAGDVNCDGIENVGDIVYKVSYLYRGGPPPCGL